MYEIEITKKKFLEKHEHLVDLMSDCWMGRNTTNIVFKNRSLRRFRKSNNEVSIYSNLSEAYQDFQWGSDDFCSSTRKLLDLQVKIRKDIRTDSKGDLLAHLCEVLAWGGVLTTAVTTPLLVKYQQNELLSYFEWIYEKSPFDASSMDFSELGKLPSNAGVLLSNSGLTKIYSVIGSRCVIYDNRVSAALGKIIIEYLAEKPLAPELGIVMGPNPRDPSTARHKFPKKSSGASHILAHAKSNVIVNWLILNAVDQLLTCSSAFKDEVNKQLSHCCEGHDITRDEKWMAMRIYESGLFMAGHSV